MSSVVCYWHVDETCPLLVNADHVVTEPGCPPIAGIGVTCRQRCNDGYIQAGGSTLRTCTTQLSWSGTPPRCIAGRSCFLSTADYAQWNTWRC